MDWRAQLESDLAPLLPPGTWVWLRAENAYYCAKFAEYSQQRGWEHSISLSNTRNQAPIVRRLEAREFSAQDWTALDEGGGREALLMMHQSSGWGREEAYAVVRSNSDDGEQRLIPHLLLISDTAGAACACASAVPTTAGPRWPTRRAVWSRPHNALGAVAARHPAAASGA